MSEVREIRLTVNGKSYQGRCEPRKLLVDFVREDLGLTGTHIGCEHGICGACTILFKGEAARSCLMFAVQAEGAELLTVEGLAKGDEWHPLQQAFHEHHALQCGYCTPGMLISARDLVLRLDTADERSIRVGLSGNLCRCTGYVGIVRAVRSVIEQRRKRGILPIPGAGREQLGPVGSGNSANATISRASLSLARSDPPEAEEPPEAGGAITVPDFVPDKVFEQRFTVAHSPDRVFDLFGDIGQIAACLPGASLTGVPALEHVAGTIRVKLGPISANFGGVARIERNPENLSGRIVGMGSDRRGRSSTQGEIRYRLAPIEQGAATRVELTIGYSLRGMLAQIAREGLVRDLAARLTADFAGNLDRHLSGIPQDRSAEGSQKLDGVSLLINLLRVRTREAFERLQRR
jgi:aerobic carbon-monoxide dehydrogenase small subunit